MTQTVCHLQCMTVHTGITGNKKTTSNKKMQGKLPCIFFITQFLYNYNLNIKKWYTKVFPQIFPEQNSHFQIPDAR